MLVLEIATLLSRLGMLFGAHHEGNKDILGYKVLRPPFQTISGHVLVRSTERFSEYRMLIRKLSLLLYICSLNSTFTQPISLYILAVV